MKADCVMALIQAHVENDRARFRTMALQLAAHEAARSPATAERIKRLLARAPLLVPLPQDVSDLLLPRPCVDISNMVLDSRLRAEVERVLVEHQPDHLTRFLAHGIRPTRRLLFSGPPGTGKTMLASAIGGAIGLPVLLVQLHSLVGSHLGDTSKSVARIFDTMRSVRAVYVFDELDAIGGGRGNSSDVGEMNRVVCGLLQQLDNADSESIIVGTTNRADIIDRALFRRFHVRVHFSLPSREDAVAISAARLGALFTGSPSLPFGAFDGLSHADIAEACDAAARSALIRGVGVDADLLGGELRRRAEPALAQAGAT